MKLLRDRILPAIEPGSLSGPNMRRAEKLCGGRRGLSKVLEFGTGLTDKFELVGQLRCVSKFIVLCQQLYGRRGARCQ
eukprot:3095265-Amphidinium_carterae.1